MAETVTARSLLQRLFVLQPVRFPEERTPPRALGLSVLALLVAAATAVLRPLYLREYWGFMWVLALVPSFLFSYYRGLRGAALALAAGMALLTLVEVGAASLLWERVDWWIYATTGVGLTVVSLGSGVVTELLQRGGGDPHLADRRWQTGRALKRALADDEFVLHYQPIVDLADGGVAGAEVLIRWQHPAAGLLPPNLFLPTAEATELILPLGEWVIRRVCQETGRARERFGGTERFFLSVNLSPVQGRDPDRLARSVTEATETYGIAPGRLQFELTESGLLDASEGVEALRELGCAVVIDDFGSDVPLSHLTSLDVDGIKIDRSFTSELERDDRSVAVVASTVELGRRLGLDVTGEGIETRTQEERLTELGCDYGQGFLFGSPLALDDVVPRELRREAREPGRG